MGRGPLIEEFYLAEENLESYYFSHPCSAMAIHCDIPMESKRARELEAYGYDIHPPLDGERACFAVESIEGIDEVSIAAVRRGLRGNITPEEVRDIYEAYRDSEIADAWWIGMHCRQHVHTVVAILYQLHEQGFILERLNRL